MQINAFSFIPYNSFFKPKNKLQIVCMFAIRFYFFQKSKHFLSCKYVVATAYNILGYKYIIKDLYVCKIQSHTFIVLEVMYDINYNYWKWAFWADCVTIEV